MMTEGDPHLPVSSSLSLRMQAGGIATAQDVSKTVALKYALLEEIMTRDIVAIGLSDPIGRTAKKMNEHNISAFSVVDEGQRGLE